MNKLFAILFTLFFISIFHFNGFAQEKYGSTLNLGLGIGGYSGYYKYTGRSLSVFHINYEFDLAKNFSLAPFISFSTYSDRTYWGQNKSTYHLQEQIM